MVGAEPSTKDVLIRKYGGVRGTRKAPNLGAAKCIFCDAPASLLTKEHVFSKWTHKFMPLRRTGRADAFRGVHYPQDTALSQWAVVKLPGQLRDWQIKCVCGGTHTTCNGGWMKRIEDKARPILAPLIKGDYTQDNPIRILPEQMEVIAAWAALKVMVAEFDEGNRPITHHSHRRYIRRRGLAPAKSRGVWIGHLDRRSRAPEWISLPFAVVPESMVAKRPNRKATYFNGNSTTQAINKLFIHVIHSPMPNLVERWRFSLPEGGSLFRIWPPSNFSLMWPGAALTDIDADVAANAFRAMLIDIAQEAIAAGRP